MLPSRLCATPSREPFRGGTCFLTERKKPPPPPKKNHSTLLRDCVRCRPLCEDGRVPKRQWRTITSSVFRLEKLSAKSHRSVASPFVGCPKAELVMIDDCCPLLMRPPPTHPKKPKIFDLQYEGLLRSPWKFCFST